MIVEHAPVRKLLWMDEGSSKARIAGWENVVSLTAILARLASGYFQSARAPRAVPTPMAILFALPGTSEATVVPMSVLMALRKYVLAIQPMLSATLRRSFMFVLSTPGM